MTSYKIEQSFIDEVVARNDIVKVIESYIPLKKQGHNHTAPCPFHQENTPSFSVSSTKQFYHCFGCKASGNVITFIMEHEKLGFMDTLEKLANSVGMTIPNQSVQTSSSKKINEVLESACNYYETQLKEHADATTAINYLKGRGISGSIAKLFRLGYSLDAWSSLTNSLLKKQYKLEYLDKAGLVVMQSQQKHYDRFRNRVIFPIRNHRGQVVGFGGRSLNDKDKPKYLNSPETQVFHKGQIFYGLYESIQENKKLDQVIIVEGYLDVIALFQHKFCYSVATLGTATTKEHINLLTRFTKKIIFCFDGDNAGKTAAQKALLTCIDSLTDDLEVRFILLPEGEDPDSLITKKGADEFQKSLDGSVAIDQFLLASMSNELDLSQATHRSKLIANCMPLINKIPGKIIARIILEQLSHLVKLPVNELEKFNPRTVPKEAPAIPTKAPPIIAQVAAILLQNPAFNQYLSSELITEMQDNTHCRVILWLADNIEQNPKITTAGLVEKVRDNPKQYNVVTSLASYVPHLEEELLEEEFKGLLKKLLSTLYGTKIDALLNKCNTSELENSERILLSDLIKRQKGL